MEPVEFVYGVLLIAFGGGVGGFLTSLGQKRKADAEGADVMAKIGPQVADLGVQSLSGVIKTLSERLQAEAVDNASLRDERDAKDLMAREAIGVYVATLRWVKAGGQGKMPAPHAVLVEQVPESLRMWL